MSRYLCAVRGAWTRSRPSPIEYFASVISAVKASKADAAALTAQATCPISGKDLGSMGGPIKISRAGKSVFVCCAGCVNAVTKAADEHLGPIAPLANAGPDH